MALSLGEPVKQSTSTLEPERSVSRNICLLSAANDNVSRGFIATEGFCSPSNRTKKCCSSWTPQAQCFPSGLKATFSQIDEKGPYSLPLTTMTDRRLAEAR